MKRKRGRPVKGHVKVQFNLLPEVSRLISEGAVSVGITRSGYIEKLVMAAQKRPIPVPLKKR
jgi:hypothetical protein